MTIKIKKNLLDILAFAACTMLVGASSCNITKSNSSSSASSSISSTSAPKSLNEQLQMATGKVTLTLSDETEIETTASTTTLLGTSGIEEIVLDGGESGAILKATGRGIGAIQAAGDGLLILKNLTVVDESAFYGDYRRGYLEFGGKLRFENCRISDSVYLKNNIDAEFVDCTFYSSTVNRYAVWVAEGSATFENCTFTGYRGIKIHEEDNMDVASVIVDGCFFLDILEKPGIAIGSIVYEPQTTVIAVRNSTFTNCQPWDRVGSIEGIDGFYEADTATSEFSFVAENNTVNGNPA